MSQSERKTPEGLFELMESKYKEACKPVESFQIYSFTGNEEHYYFMTPENKIITSEDIVSAHLKKTPPAGLPVEVLDLGTGLGRVPLYLDTAFSKYVKACGITAHNSAPKSDVIIYGNVEFLEKIPELKGKKFDIIFACHVFVHVVDQIRLLEKAYELLKDGGVLAIRGLILPGLQEYYRELISYLREKGYEITFHNHSAISRNTQFLNMVLISKHPSLPNLKIPCDYKEIDSHCVYAPNREFKEWLAQKKSAASLQTHSLLAQSNSAVVPPPASAPALTR